MTDMPTGWQMRGFDDFDRADWLQHGFRSDSAKRWRDAGFEAGSAEVFRSCKLTPKQASEWVEAAEGTEFDDSDLAALIERGLTPQHVQYEWAEWVAKNEDVFEDPAET